MTEYRVSGISNGRTGQAKRPDDKFDIRPSQVSGPIPDILTKIRRTLNLISDWLPDIIHGRVFGQFLLKGEHRRINLQRGICMTRST